VALVSSVPGTRVAGHDAMLSEYYWGWTNTKGAACTAPFVPLVS